MTGEMFVYFLKMAILEIELPKLDEYISTYWDVQGFDESLYDMQE